MPDSVLPLLTRNNRLDFMDFISSDMKAEETNRLKGSSEMTRLTEDYCFIRLSALSTAEMKLLPLEDGGKVICMVLSRRASVWDSQVCFFTTEWKRLESGAFLDMPDVISFVSFPEDMPKWQRENVLNRLYPAFFSVKMQESSTDLVITFTTPEYLNEDDRKEVSQFVTATKTAVWKSDRFVW